MLSGSPALGNVTWSETTLPMPPTSVPPVAYDFSLLPATPLDTGDDRFLGAVWQNGVLWAAGNTGCVPPGDLYVRSCLRLVQVSTTAYQVIQSFDLGYSPPAGYLMYPAVGLDPAGNMTVVFSAVGNFHPGVYAAYAPAAGPAYRVFGLTPLSSGTTAYYCRSDPFGGGPGPGRAGDGLGCGGVLCACGCGLQLGYLGRPAKGEGKLQTVAAFPGRELTLAAFCWLLALSLGCAGPAAPRGTLEGTVTIGPLRPGERAGEPSPSPPPELCRQQEFRVLDEAGRTELLRFKAGPDCGFRVELAAGRYRLDYVGPRPALAKDLPKVIEMRPGETTRTEIHIDTGIR